MFDGFVMRPWIVELIDRLKGQGIIPAIPSDQSNWLDSLEAVHHFSIEITTVNHHAAACQGSADAYMIMPWRAGLKMFPIKSKKKLGQFPPMQNIQHR
jgi:hypothetical protein